MTPTQTEIKALVRLLQQDWESPEQLAKALIEELDDTRGSRTLQVAVVQYGDPSGTVFYDAVGPIAGQVSAKKVLSKMLYKSIVSKGAVVPLRNLEGFEAKMAKVDLPARPKN